jgi:hypothetical protein
MESASARVRATDRAHLRRPHAWGCAPPPDVALNKVRGLPTSVTQRASSSHTPPIESKQWMPSEPQIDQHYPQPAASQAPGACRASLDGLRSLRPLRGNSLSARADAYQTIQSCWVTYGHRLHSMGPAMRWPASRTRVVSGTAERCTDSWGCSSIGRAFDWQSKGRGFESPQLHQILI